ncbi:hypothetical protein NDU88_005408 [Pleurodeles waltl]|uniref:Uncharacterized protein n=1 Tax=Pleurodeles waltl TaxID=8319 RepID=A0AAV7LPH2_PLEWA|nr:hypothetical protein NDU88_005408 [Pleurodeles waltl]
MRRSSGAFFPSAGQSRHPGPVGTLRRSEAQGEDGVTGTAHSLDAAPLGRVAICCFYARGEEVPFLTGLLRVSPVGGPAAFRPPRAAPAALAVPLWPRSLPRSSASRRGPHDRGTARGPRPPEERLQPKELRCAVRV